MKKEIAWALMQVAHQHQYREFTAWGKAKSMQDGESHRLACASWAEAANELYAIARPAQHEQTRETGGSTV